MGACASMPKDLKKQDAAIPEAPVTPKKPDVPLIPEENKDMDGEETMKEEPLVDLSEPAPEAPKAAADVVPEPTSEPAGEETPVAAIQEDNAPKVEEKKEAEAVTEAAV
ncbi:PREDICTED: uncharacterized protein LOC109193797 isoform X2 [Ipomoea nil]|uniref:uncharacterized protein LOC109193797 isoform X2 n=1 Tax=Ipomoea nil TaxID=35883 RepID=UPI0009010543|nr:PREDICTED: uncharacterized protein LOC109193797 isoform X2 [Ipomoea nil]